MWLDLTIYKYNKFTPCYYLTAFIEAEKKKYDQISLTT